MMRKRFFNFQSSKVKSLFTKILPNWDTSAKSQHGHSKFTIRWHIQNATSVVKCLHPSKNDKT